MSMFKKSIIVFTLCFLGILLSGCEGNNEMEFCVEFPDDESCVVDISKSANDVFKGLYNHYLENKDEFCMKYVFSEESDNSDCGISDLSLLPDDLNSYTITSSNDQITNDNVSHSYTFENNSGSMTIVLDITYEIIDNSFLIRSLEYSETIVDSTTTLPTQPDDDTSESDKTKKTVVALFQEYLEQINKGKFNTDLKCSTVYIGMTQAECEAEIDFISNNDVIYSIELIEEYTPLVYTIYVKGTLDDVIVSHFEVNVSIPSSRKPTELFYSKNVHVTYLEMILIKLDITLGNLDQSVENIPLIKETMTFEDDEVLYTLAGILDNYYDYKVTRTSDIENLYTVRCTYINTGRLLNIRFDYNFTDDQYVLEILEEHEFDLDETDFNALLWDFVPLFNDNSTTLDELDPYFVSGIPKELLETKNQNETIKGAHIFYRPDGVNVLLIWLPTGRVYYDVNFVELADGTYQFEYELIEFILY